MLALEMRVTALGSPMSVGNSGLTLCVYLSSVGFYFVCLYDKHCSTGLPCRAHFTQLSVVPGLEVLVLLQH